jgi:soluble lytic murein transglycosylase
MKLFIIPLLLGMCSVSFFAVKADLSEEQIDKIEQAMVQSRNIMMVDTDRLSAQGKIANIISRFNPDMPDGLKHAIGLEIYRMSVKYPNLDVDLICATITHESARTWDSEVVSRAGALGLMQVMPSTGRWLARHENINWTTDEEVLFNPIYNIRLGTRYLSELIDAYELEGGLAAYNGGGKRVELWLANNKADGILWAETRAYVPFVLKLYDEFKEYAM